MAWRGAVVAARATQCAVVIYIGTPTTCACESEEELKDRRFLTGELVVKITTNR